jgi:hypothetical protein
MAKIIAGSFPTAQQAEDVVHALRNAGFDSECISMFHNNPPGQHDRTPVGGDENADPEAKGAEKNSAKVALAGAGLGAGIGAALGGPIGAVAGAGVGAYTGALGGTLAALGDEEATLPPQRRPAGIIVAVNANGNSMAGTAIALMEDHHPVAVEEAEGEWRDGQWADFDPLASPHLVWRDPQSHHTR